MTVEVDALEFVFYKLTAWAGICFTMALPFFRWQTKDIYKDECAMRERDPDYPVDPLDMDSALKLAVLVSASTIGILVVLAFLRALISVEVQS